MIIYSNFIFPLFMCSPENCILYFCIHRQVKIGLKWLTSSTGKGDCLH